MKPSIFIAILAVCIIPTCLAAPDKGGLGPQTDFKSMTAEQALNILRNAQSINVDGPVDENFKFDEKVCNGKKHSSNYSAEADCGLLGSWNYSLAFSMAALFRGCGVYAVSPENTWGDNASGATCGMLGARFAALGNFAAARAIWEQAPGCHSHDKLGNAVNGCMAIILSPYPRAVRSIQEWFTTFQSQRERIYESDPARLYVMAEEACTSAKDVDSCSYISSHGGQVNMADVRAVQQERESNREDFDKEKRAERQEKERESDARFNTVMGTLQSMAAPNGSNQGINTTSPGPAQAPSTSPAAASGSSGNGITETCPSMQAYPDAGASCNPVRIVNTCIRIVSNTWNPPSSTGGAGQLRVVYHNVCNFKVRLTVQPTVNLQGVNNTGEQSNVDSGQQYAFTTGTANPPPSVIYQSDDGVDCSGNIDRPGCTNFPH